MNLAQMASLPIRKYLHTMLGSKYVEHDETVQRMLSALSLDSDLKKSGSLFQDIYMAGFNAAVEQYRGELEKLGRRVEVVHSKKEENRY